MNKSIEYIYILVPDKTVHTGSSEIWVVTRDVLKVLEGFHHWAAQIITGMAEKRGTGGEWE